MVVGPWEGREEERLGVGGAGVNSDDSASAAHLGSLRTVKSVEDQVASSCFQSVTVRLIPSLSPFESTTWTNYKKI